MTMEERCIGYYTNRQKILLVGEGDFSFASCLADAFGSLSYNITATSLDSKDVVITKYLNGEDNLWNLKLKEAKVIHGVDVHTMNTHPQLSGKFDRIVFNFPHAGNRGKNVTEYDTAYIQRHRELVRGFFKAARDMLTENGEVHVTHKTTYPFDKWNIVELAANADLVLTREATFDRLYYPGYVNKRGFRSPKWDSSFPVGEASTFMFC